VIAIEQDLIDGRADLAVAGVHERQAQIARREFNAVEILRDLPGLREHRDSRRMRELLDRLVVHVLEADCFGQRRDRLLVFNFDGTKLASLRPKPPDKLEGASALAIAGRKLYVLCAFGNHVSQIDLVGR